MGDPASPQVEWVVLTTGDRPDQLVEAVRSLGESRTCVVYNGASAPESGPPSSRLLELPGNVGVPAGRDEGLRSSDAEVVGFLDDDAVASPGVSERVRATFGADRRIGAVALRLVDEDGWTARRHVPRLGRKHVDESGSVALVLGGACAIRRDAYLDAGGYFVDLFYGHEEVELCWRLIDRGWMIRYLADVDVFHPRTDIGRHPDGWRLTGRNRVWIARRTLPWPVAIVHVLAWLALGTIRAPRDCRRSYIRGWVSGWREPIEHRPIRWQTVWRLTRLGRPPII